MSLSVEAVAVAKKYTDNSILGIVGVLAGKNCTIKNITKEGIINTVEFEWTADDGTKKTSQMQVSDGVSGEDGIGIESIDKIATLGLIDTYQILYSDGTTQNFSVTNGKDGVQRVRLTTDGNHIYDKDNNILTFVQVKDLVMDSDKFVTLTLDNNISFLPSAYDGSAIWFDAGFIESGVPNQLRVIINDQNQVNLDQIELAKKSVVDGLVSDVEELQDFCKIDPQPSNALTQTVNGLYVKKSESGEPYDDTEVRQLIQANTDDITSLGGRTTNIESDITSIESDISDLDLATQDLETNKVDKVDGKGLSTNDLTNELKEKYDKAEENVQSDWNETDNTSDAYIKNKPNLDDFGKIQSISVDGDKITPDQDKNVDIDLSGKVDKEENKSLVDNTDITQITTNKNAIALLNDTDEVEGSVRNIVKRAVEGSMHLSKQFIDHKPTVEEAKENILYLVPIDDEGTCEQYVLAENKVVMIGSTKVDLSDYYNKQEIDNIVDEIQLYKFPNAIIYGEPTINNGQISNFSNANYLILPSVFNLSGRGFEFKFAFTTNNDVTTAQNILGGKYCMALYVQNGKLTLRVSSNGTSWDLVNIEGSTAIEANKTYYVKINFTRLNYTLSLSTDDDTYEEIGSVSVGDISPNPSELYIGIGNNFNNPFKGIINLNKCYLKVNQSIVWQGMDDAGLATRLATDLENIDESGVVKIKEIAETDKKVNIQQKTEDKGKALVVGEDGKVVPTEISTDTSEVEKVIADNWNKNGYNLIPYPYYHSSRVNNGVNFTVNNDGTVLVDGTATANAFLDFVEPKTFKVKKGTYKISSGETSEGFLVIWNIDTDKHYNELSGIFTFDEDATCSLYIYIPSGKTISNTLFYPMLVKVNEDGLYPTEYQRYALGNVKLTDKLDTKADSSIILKDNLFIADNFTMKNTDTIKSVDNGDGTYTINTYLNSEGKFPNNTPFNQKVNANKLDLYDFKGKKLYLRLDVLSGNLSQNWLGFIVAKYKEDGTSTTIYPFISNKDVGVHQIVSYNVDDIIAEGYRYIAFQPWLSNNNVYTDVVMRIVVTTEEWNYNVQDFKYTGYGLNNSLGDKADKGDLVFKYYPMIATRSLNCNDITDYECIVTANNDNWAEMNYPVKDLLLITTHRNADDGYQEVRTYRGERKFIRTMVNTVWQPWQELATMDKIPKLVNKTYTTDAGGNITLGYKAGTVINIYPNFNNGQEYRINQWIYNGYIYVSVINSQGAKVTGEVPLSIFAIGV